MSILSKLSGRSGFTLVETMIALFLAGIISLAALQFLTTENNTMLVQQNISEMQQNLRTSVAEISFRLRNAGANLPAQLIPIEMSDANPDTLVIRYAAIGGALDVGEHTQKKQASPIHVTKGSDLSGFSAGQRVYLSYSSTGQGEWFTITKVSTNNGSGWEQVHHQGQPLLFDPMPGDKLLALEEAKYFIDASDTLHPMLMRALSGETPQPYADDITDFQLLFVLSTGASVSAITPSDTVVAGTIFMSAQTAGIDYETHTLDQDGRRDRSLTTDVIIRNRRR